jgi:hypothetical protein
MEGFARWGATSLSVDTPARRIREKCFKLVDKVRVGYDMSSRIPNAAIAFRNLAAVFNARATILYGQPRNLEAKYFACQRFVMAGRQVPTHSVHHGASVQSVTVPQVTVTHRSRLTGAAAITQEALFVWTTG